MESQQKEKKWQRVSTQKIEFSRNKFELKTSLDLAFEKINL